MPTMAAMAAMAPPTKISVNTTNPPSPINLGFDLSPSNGNGWELPAASEDLSALFGVATGDEDEIQPKVPVEQPMPSQSAAPSMQERSSQSMPQPLCLTPPSSSLLTSACVSPFELDKRPGSQASDGKKPTDDAEEPLTQHQESEYTAFVNTLLAV